MPSPSQFDPKVIFTNVAAGLAGGVAVAYYTVQNPDLMDLATSMNGPLGAALGCAAGAVVADQSVIVNATGGFWGFVKSATMFLPLAGAIAVPSLVEMRLTSSSVMIGVGAAAGQWAVSMIPKTK